ncbi:MAG TPA: histidine phosphatase family protein [Pirellulales bacterium]|nr:histidine phosphatase family protein [Pirellulales bacterium]
MRRILMVRHGSVAERYRGRCYGRSDVELGDEGRRQTQDLAERLSALPITHLFHSGLSRARELADQIAGLTGLAPLAAVELQELDFGDWELWTWDEIHAAAPDALDRLLREPATFSPPGGETAFALCERVLGWYRRLPPHGLIVAIAHGGSIAALRGTLAGWPASEWAGLIPRAADVIEVTEQVTVADSGRSVPQAGMNEPDTTAALLTTRVGHQFGQLVLCKGCCCGRTAGGFPEVPVERIKAVWKAEKLNRAIQLTISGCLGPCDVANVAVVITRHGIDWFGGLAGEAMYDLLVDWARACQAAGSLLPVPRELLAKRVDRFVDSIA